MELKIEIDETMFKDVVEKELAAFSKEELHGIIEQAIHEYLMNNDVLRKLFVETSNDRWGRSSNKATYLLQSVIEKIDVSPVFEEIKQNVLNYIKEDSTVHNLSLELFSNIIEKGVNNYIWTNPEFRGQLSHEISCQVMEEVHR